MTFIRKPGLAPFLASLCLACFNVNAQTLDPTQVYTTGNIVEPTIQGSGTTPWVNGVYQDQLTCWASGDPGYCGPNPIVRPDGNINFSFGLTDLYQTQAIANALPNSGTGLRVNGYNFGFAAKNGNGWDDGMVDTLSAYVKFYDASGGVVVNDYYDLNYQFNWTPFNYSKNFTTPYASSDLSSVQYGFVGKDNNFWAGPYGPEIQGVSFSLKYSVGPCYVNVLSSPSCPGYLEELAKYNTSITDTNVALAPSQETNNSDTEDIAQAQSNTDSGSSSGQTQATVSGAPPPSTSSVTGSIDGSTSTSSTEITSTVSSSVTATRRPGVPENLMSIVRSELDRINQVENSVVQSSADMALQQAQSTMQQAEQVAKQSSDQSQAAFDDVMSQNTQFSALQQDGAGPGSTGNLGSGISATASIGITQQDVVATAVQNSISSNSAVRTQTNTYSLSMGQIDNERTETLMASRYPVGVTTPANNYLENMMMVDTAKLSQGRASVIRPSADNKLADGTSLVAYTDTSKGFDQYLNTTMVDNRFYEIKEIYSNQQNVDNRRALRNLASDQLHQQMVNMQYRR